MITMIYTPGYTSLDFEPELINFSSFTHCRHILSPNPNCDCQIIINLFLSHVQSALHIRTTEVYTDGSKIGDNVGAAGIIQGVSRL